MEVSRFTEHTSGPDSAAYQYLYGLSEAELGAAEKHVQPLLLDGPLAQCTVLIPVAAKQEAHNVARSMGCYAKQETEAPFTIILGLNADVPSTDESVAQTLHAVEVAKSTHPNLDIRSIYSQIETTATIGSIRRELWNSALYAGVRGGTISSEADMFGINHDIDVVSMPRRYMRRVQDFANDPIRSISPTYTELRHASDPMTPNVSRYTYWSDFLHREHLGGAGYEAGAIVPMRYYAEQGGIDANEATNEINTLVYPGARRALWKTGLLQTSPRRFQSRLSVAGAAKIWTTDSFTTEDECRENQFTPTDITERQLRLNVLQTSYMIPGVILNPKKLPAALPEADKSKIHTQYELFRYYETILKRRREIAVRVLAQCVQLPDMVDTLIGPASRDIQEVADSHAYANYGYVEDLRQLDAMRQLITNLEKRRKA